MVEILTWISIISGGILILLLLLSLLGGLDLDLDVDADIGAGETASGSGGLGIAKGVLTFISVTAWVIKVFLVTQQHPGIAIVIGIASGIAALVLLNYLVRAMMNNDAYVNWSMEDALFLRGKVYLKIPKGVGTGIVYVNIKGVDREIKARSFDGEEIKTGEHIAVMAVDGEFVIVKRENEVN